MLYQSMFNRWQHGEWCVLGLGRYLPTYTTDHAVVCGLIFLRQRFWLMHNTPSDAIPEFIWSKTGPG